MATHRLIVNGREHILHGIDPSTPLLWVLRDFLGLHGTKYGCGMALCGACTVHLNGGAVRSCSLPVAAAEGQHVTTIEGLAPGEALHRVQAAWHEQQVVQCGYCQPGQIMSAVALLQQNPRPDDTAIEQAMAGNLCRCGTYERIRAAIKHAAAAR